MSNLLAISRMRTTLDTAEVQADLLTGQAPKGYHESLFRSFQILRQVKDWLGKGLPAEAILELIEIMETPIEPKEWAMVRLPIENFVPDASDEQKSAIASIKEAMRRVNPGDDRVQDSHGNWWAVEWVKPFVGTLILLLFSITASAQRLLGPADVEAPVKTTPAGIHYQAYGFDEPRPKWITKRTPAYFDSLRAYQLTEPFQRFSTWLTETPMLPIWIDLHAARVKAEFPNLDLSRVTVYVMPKPIRGPNGERLFWDIRGDSIRVVNVAIEDESRPWGSWLVYFETEFEKALREYATRG